MLTVTISAANQASEPILVASDRRVNLQVIDGAVDDAPLTNDTLYLQRILVNAAASDPARPNDADARWRTIKTYTLTAAGLDDLVEVGQGWFRVLSGATWTDDGGDPAVPAEANVTIAIVGL